MYYASPGPDPYAPPIAIYTAVSADGLEWTIEGEVASASALRSQFPNALSTLDPAGIRLSDGRMRVYFGLLLPGNSGGIISATSASPAKRRRVVSH